MSDRPTPIPPPRAVTPLAAFDTRPKAASSSPVDPFAGIPRLPRDPLPPSNIGAVGRELRDTDPISGSMRQEEEVTPAESPFSMRVMRRLDKFEKKLDVMAGHCGTAANTSLEVLSRMTSVDSEMAKLSKRVDAIELSEKWVPRLAWLFTTLVALFALARTYR